MPSGKRKTTRPLTEAELAARHRNSRQPHLAAQGRPNPRLRRPGSVTDQRRVRKALRIQIEEVLRELEAGRSVPPGDSTKEELYRAAVTVLERDRTEGYTPGQIAKAACELELLGCVAFWIRVRDGIEDGASMADRLRASENLTAKGGLPNLTQHEVSGELMPRKLYDLSGYEHTPATVASAEQPPAPEEPTP